MDQRTSGPVNLWRRGCRVFTCGAAVVFTMLLTPRAAWPEPTPASADAQTVAPESTNSEHPGAAEAERSAAQAQQALPPVIRFADFADFVRTRGADRPTLLNLPALRSLADLNRDGRLDARDLLSLLRAAPGATASSGAASSRAGPAESSAGVSSTGAPFDVLAPYCGTITNGTEVSHFDCSPTPPGGGGDCDPLSLQTCEGGGSDPGGSDPGGSDPGTGDDGGGDPPPEPDPDPEPFVIKSTTTDIGPGPVDLERLTIGIGEEVLLHTEPQTGVTWSRVPEENAELTDIGPSTSTGLFASQSAGQVTVTARADDGREASITFIILAPTGIAYFDDDADIPPYPLTPGDDLIGDGRRFPLVLLPLTVSFGNAALRENIPATPIHWPDGTVSNIMAQVVPFSVETVGAAPNFIPNAAADEIVMSPTSITALDDAVTGVRISFSFARPVPLEYKNADGMWVQFTAAGDNVHVREFSAQGSTTIRAVGEPGTAQQASQPRGPWENPQ